MADDASAELEALFFELHQALPRQGPGDRQPTERAYHMLGSLPCRTAILDLGCGPGMQTLDLAELSGGSRIIAVDIHEPFLHQAACRVVRRGLADRIHLVRADMRRLPFAEGALDVIWSEGTAYLMGLAQALGAWRQLLRPGGGLALTEAVWLRPDPPSELRRFWNNGYPGMQDIAGCRRVIEAAGYRLLGDFVLPSSAWWNDYYIPLEAALRPFRRRAGRPEERNAVAVATEMEISHYRRFSEYYGYAFFVMRS